MAVEYVCPKCKSRLAVAEALAPGQQMMCPECEHVFAPPAAAKKAKPTAPAAEPPPEAPKTHASDDDDANPYGVVKETEEERKLAEKNKPRFDVRDKGKKSARGPAMALLVMPSNLMIAQGALTCVVGLGAVVVGLWPIVFADAPPSSEELADFLFTVFCGLFAMAWGGLTCFGAAQMQNLNSYAWGIVGGVIGILPLLAGVFALATLRDPRVIEGFREPEGGVTGDVDEEKKEGDEDEDDEDDEEEDDEEEEEPRPKKKRKRS